MEKMKEITCKEEFLRWAKDVNFSSENKRNGICDLQDVFTRNQNGEMKALKGWYLEVSHMERQALTFSIIKAMGEETAFRFLKAWALKQANQCIEDNQKAIEDGYDKLTKERHIFVTEKKEIEAKIPVFEAQITNLTMSLDESQSNNDGLYQTIQKLENRIYTLTADLDEAYRVVNETNKFKSYLKTVLNAECLE